MSTPFVSGVCALVYPMLGARDSGTAASAEGVLRQGAQSLGATDPAYASLLGAGRISAAGSVAAVVAARPGVSTDPDPIAVRPTP
jgi:hypothetical protein